MARNKNFDWGLPDKGNTYHSASLAVLMDIRDELKELNEKQSLANQHLSVLACSNFIAIPRVLRLIEKNTKKPKPKVKQ